MTKIFPYMVLFFLVPVAFALNAAAGRFSADIMGPVAMVFFRWFGVVIIMLPLMAKALWQIRHIIKKYLKLFIVSSIIGMIICPYFTYVAGYTTTTINIVLIYTSLPILTIILEWIFYGNRIPFKNFIGVIIAIFGVVYIITQGNFRSLSAINFSIGDLWAFISVTCFSVYSILIRKQEQHITGIQLFIINSLFGTLLAVPLLAYEIIALEKPIVLSHEFFLLWGMLSIVSAIFGYLGMVYIIKSFNVTKASYVSYLVVLYGAGIGIIFLGETLQKFHIISAVIILGGIFIAMYKDKKNPTPL